MMNFDDMKKIKIKVQREKSSKPKINVVSLSNKGVLTFNQSLKDQLVSNFSNPTALIRVQDNYIGIKIVEKQNKAVADEGEKVARPISKTSGVVSAKQILTNADENDKTKLMALLNSEKTQTIKFTEGENLTVNKDGRVLMLDANGL